MGWQRNSRNDVMTREARYDQHTRLYTDSFVQGKWFEAADRAVTVNPASHLKIERLAQPVPDIHWMADELPWSRLSIGARLVRSSG